MSKGRISEVDSLVKCERELSGSSKPCSSSQRRYALVIRASPAAIKCHRGRHSVRRQAKGPSQVSCSFMASSKGRASIDGRRNSLHLMGLDKRVGSGKLGHHTYLGILKGKQTTVVKAWCNNARRESLRPSPGLMNELRVWVVSSKKCCKLAAEFMASRPRQSTLETHPPPDRQQTRAFV